ncbi:MAG TPA: glycosyltransferase [Streptosporangiaceae bacterium]|nr:glycosyltransferase [Streptosporangiaceae bacterium]
MRPSRSLPLPGRSSMLSLSVIIPVYRQSRCLDMTLGSLAAQTPSPGEFEVIVVDDGSGDDTAAVVGKHEASLPVRLVQHGVNRGRAAARNSGAAVAESDRLLLLDADSYADPGLLDAHARFGRSFPGKVLLGARNEWSWQLVADQPAPLADLARGPVKDLRFVYGLEPAAVGTSDVPWIFGHSHNMSLPAADFRACGGFDENFTGWGYEDIDFAYRLYVAAGRATDYFQFDTAALCHHLPHFRLSAENWAQAAKTVTYFIDKHHSLEVEFINEGPLFVCDLLPAYLRRLRLLHAADRAGRGEQVLATLPPAVSPGRLAIGIGLAGHAPDDGMTEFIDHRPPDAHTAPGLIGLRLPFPDGRFADLVNIDLWRVLWPNHLPKLVVEGLRVAKTLYLGYSRHLVEASEAGLIAGPDYVCDMLNGRYCQASISDPADDILWIKTSRR